MNARRHGGKKASIERRHLHADSNPQSSSFAREGEGTPYEKLDVLGLIGCAEGPDLSANYKAELWKSKGE